jgi:hypothetical protein
LQAHLPSAFATGVPINEGEEMVLRSRQTGMYCRVQSGLGGGNMVSGLC